ncbi:hypothetical protein PHSY_001941 [Pseudozyma hubeiensis SY62]|uniref:Uncharacterized protein n=1 Tax=Pseudozyma hubeiensis (strain SY62) TaxID=1305764 RepID=R9P8I0_PSEHS|nr:hypothetical protein PHSY_001941 [Pseudozyma hubeiensis SY62]GAC94370.1 hypothetical protein PHSY_001941 [Pseudozyma hubeiensis SY62]
MYRVGQANRRDVSRLSLPQTGGHKTLTCRGRLGQHHSSVLSAWDPKWQPSVALWRTAMPCDILARQRSEWIYLRRLE